MKQKLTVVHEYIGDDNGDKVFRKLFQYSGHRWQVDVCVNPHAHRFTGKAAISRWDGCAWRPVYEMAGSELSSISAPPVRLSQLAGDCQQVTEYFYRIVERLLEIGLSVTGSAGEDLLKLLEGACVRGQSLKNETGGIENAVEISLDNGVDVVLQAPYSVCGGYLHGADVHGRETWRDIPIDRIASFAYSE